MLSFCKTEVIGKKKETRIFSNQPDYNLYNKMQSEIYILQHNVSLQPSGVSADCT